MQIRRFRKSDAPEVARLHRDTIRSVNTKDYPQPHIKVWSNRVSADRWAKYFGKNTIFVAVDKRKILGVASYKKDEIMAMYVHKDSIGKGVGKKLLLRLERDALKNGIKKIKCTSTVTAQSFYEKNGYKTIKKTKFKIKNKYLTVYKMKKHLQ